MDRSAAERNDATYPEDPLLAADQMREVTERLRAGLAGVIQDDGTTVIDLR